MLPATACRWFISCIPCKTRVFTHRRSRLVGRVHDNFHLVGIQMVICDCKRRRIQRRRDMIFCLDVRWDGGRRLGLLHIALKYLRGSWRMQAGRGRAVDAAVRGGTDACGIEAGAPTGRRAVWRRRRGQRRRGQQCGS
jgi:hypothetical protein